MPRLFVDMHIHSKYSAATSEIMDLEHISYYSSFKGLDIVGTGDVLQPKWLAELREKLRENGGLFSLKGRKGAPLFLLSGEVSTIYEYGGKKRRVHHVILYPSFDAVRQVSDSLKSYGDLQSNGRPILSLSSEELASLVREVDENIELFPAHIWTPHYSIFGLHGHSSIQEAYGSEWRRIHLLETGLSCYDSKTEVLTDNGWKKFSEVRHSDKICSLNLKNGGVEFQNPMGMFVYRYEGKMYRLKTKTIDLLVTPNHKLLYSPCDFRRPKPFRLREAQFLFNRSKRFKKDGIWRGKNERYFTLPAVKIRHGSRYYSGFRTKGEKRLPVKSWLKFFGFWLAEGWTTGGKNGEYRVCLANQNANSLSEMKRLLTRSGYQVYQCGNTLRVSDYQLFHYLKQFGKCSNKFIPPEMKSLSKELIEILLKYYLKGDGHVYGRTGKGVSATTTSIRLRDDLQEIALKVGISAYYKLGRKKGRPLSSLPYKGKVYKQKEDAWVIYFTRRNKPIILPSTIRKHNYIESWVNYHGLVFCVAVPNQVVYVRRNGIPLWCGNSDPEMNWSLSSLDQFQLVSNSDSHSPYPFRIGREANLFDLRSTTYDSLLEAIRGGEGSSLVMTIETFPEYGKYHWPGHRACNFSVSPDEYLKLKGTCPVCGRKLTNGVDLEVRMRADRPRGYMPKSAKPFVRVIPLSELISETLASTVTSSKVWNLYKELVERFGNEFSVLLHSPVEVIEEVGGRPLARSIDMMRQGTLKVKPGYDGQYGQLELRPRKKQQKL